MKKELHMALIFSIQEGETVDNIILENFENSLNVIKKSVGKKVPGKLTAQECANRVLSYKSAIEIIKDKNREDIIEFLVAIGWGHISKEHKRKLFKDAFTIVAFDDNDYVEWAIEITSITGIRIGYDVRDYLKADYSDFT